MISRRTLVLAALLAPLVSPAVAAPSTAGSDPVAILTDIYKRVVKDKDNDGSFVWAGDAAKAKYLSKSLTKLWAETDAHQPKDDVVGAIDFDPVTNAQDPDVTSFKVKAEKIEADKALIAVTLKAHQKRKFSADETVRYDFIREDGAWKIDDIRCSIDGKPRTVRSQLIGPLASYKAAARPGHARQASPGR